MNFIKPAILTFILILTYNASAYATSVTLVSDLWCPYTCEPNSEKEGLLVEIARIAFAKKGIKLNYEVKSWENAVADFNDTKVDGIIGVGAGEVQDPVLPSVEQSNSIIAAFTRNDTTWVYDGPSSLANKPLGIIEGASYANEITSYIYMNYFHKPDKFIFSLEKNAIEDNVTKLLSGEIFVYIEDEKVVNQYLEEKQIKNIRNAGRIQTAKNKIYIGFSHGNPEAHEYAKLITETTIALTTSGRLAEMLKKYGMPDK